MLHPSPSVRLLKSRISAPSLAEMSAITPEVLFTASCSPFGEKQAYDGLENGCARTFFFRESRSQMKTSLLSVASARESGENATEKLFAILSARSMIPSH